MNLTTIVSNGAPDSPSFDDCALSSSQEGDPTPPPHFLALHREARILAQPCFCTSEAGQHLALQQNYDCYFSDQQKIYERKTTTLLQQHR